METREQKVARYIKDSRTEMQLEMLDVRVLPATVRQWLERIHMIPDAWLDRCYQVAMDNHTKREALMAVEMVNAWKIIQGEVALLDANERVEIAQKLCRYRCSETGFYIAEGDGSTDNPAGFTYARCCPIHRPQGVPKDRRMAPWDITTRRPRQMLLNKSPYENED